MSIGKTLYRKPETLKELEEQVHQRKLESSSMPEYAVPKPKFDDRTSNGLTKCIIAYLTLLCSADWLPGLTLPVDTCKVAR